MSRGREIVWLVDTSIQSRLYSYAAANLATPIISKCSIVGTCKMEIGLPEKDAEKGSFINLSKLRRKVMMPKMMFCGASDQI